MTDQDAPILTINAGSSSIKFAIYAADNPNDTLVHGAIENIGLADTRYWSQHAGQERNTEFIHLENHDQAIDVLFDKLRAVEVSPSAIGHRIVHGGPKLKETCELNDEVLALLDAIVPLDPEHLPAELLLIRRFREAFPDALHIGCFDTAFHHTMPAVAQLLPIPRRFYELGVRRYGFHGLSYEYILSELQQLDNDAAMGRVVMAHLGSGASLVAVHHGQPIDTTMGFTPAGGIPMSSRSGDIDPGITPYLMREHNLSIDDISQLFNHESGLLGLSETSADMKQLIDDSENDQRAAETVELFCYQVRKSIASLAASMGGIDTLVFSGGMAEASSIIRERVCRDLEFIGITLDSTSNDHHEPVISAPDSRVRVRIIPTDESATIARHTHNLLKKQKSEGGDYGIN